MESYSENSGPTHLAQNFPQFQQLSLKRRWKICIAFFCCFYHI